MPLTVQEVYDEIIQALSPADRSRLATLILNELVQQNLAVVDRRDDWTKQDQVDVANFSLQYANSLFSSPPPQKP